MTAGCRRLIWVPARQLWQDIPFYFIWFLKLFTGKVVLPACLKFTSLPSESLLQLQYLQKTGLQVLKRQPGSLLLVFWIPEYIFEDVYIPHGGLFIDTCHAEDGVISQWQEKDFIFPVFLLVFLFQGRENCCMILLWMFLSWLIGRMYDF